jgi:hypothetical protein
MEFLNLIKKLIRWFYPSKKYEGDFWTLKEFINHYGKMQVHIFTDSLGNQSIDRCIFTDCIGRETEVYVAKVLQSYTIEDLKRKKDKLFITTLKSGNLCLCEKWEDIKIEGWES